MNTHDLTRHYDQLTAQERFALLLAAEARGDQREFRQLMDTAPRKNYSVPHHAPLVDVFLDVSKMFFMKLLEAASCYLDSFPLPDRKRRKDADPLAGWHEVMLLGYLFRTSLEGWRLFCAELQIDPEFMWESWPGYTTAPSAFPDRIRRQGFLAPPMCRKARSATSPVDRSVSTRRWTLTTLRGSSSQSPRRRALRRSCE
jgi:hypothetical protein